MSKYQGKLTLGNKRKTEQSENRFDRENHSNERQKERRTGGNGERINDKNKKSQKYNKGNGWSNNTNKDNFKKSLKKKVKPNKEGLTLLDKRVTDEKFLSHPRVKDAQKLLRVFGNRFDFKNPLPLSKGCYKQAMEKIRNMGLPFSGRLIRRAFKAYAESPLYAKVYVVGAMRYDLNSRPTTAITQEEVDLANEIVRDTRKSLQSRAAKRKQEEKCNQSKQSEKVSV